MDKRSSVSALCSPLAKYSEMVSCPSLRTLTPKRFFFWSKGNIFAPWSTQTIISMGSRETEAKELAVMPLIVPGSRSTVTTVTPVVKWPSALRNSNGVSRGVGIFEVFEDTILRTGKEKRRMPTEIADVYDRGASRNPERSEESWREKSRYWEERERKAPGWRTAWRKPGKKSSSARAMRRARRGRRNNCRSALAAAFESREWTICRQRERVTWPC